MKEITKKKSFKKVAKVASVVKPTTMVYISNLNYERKESAIKSLFLPYGDVKVVKLLKEGRDNKSKGVAFVEMFVRADALVAIKELNGRVVDDRTLKVSEAKPQAFVKAPVKKELPVMLKRIEKIKEIKKAEKKFDDRAPSFLKDLNPRRKKKINKKAR
ncbi:MAG: RNA-binding protein [Bacteriovoracaceae bacterium]|nr:RNA-binding protein [Bacteriovoracaceae bacterium]